MRAVLAAALLAAAASGTDVDAELGRASELAAQPAPGADAELGAAVEPELDPDPELGAAAEPEVDPSSRERMERGESRAPHDREGARVSASPREWRSEPGGFGLSAGDERAGDERERAAPGAPRAQRRPGRQGGAALTPGDLAVARIAWRYFERNYQPATGLVNATDGYPSTTLWDLGSTLFGTIAARELGLLPKEAFDRRASALLRTLATQPLFHGEVPNKAYDTATGRMTDYENHPTPRGIGSSAVDLGRLVSALTLLAGSYPEHRREVAAVLRRWRWCRVVGRGEMHGALVDASGGLKVVQEGRLGYEQYAAHGLAGLGLDLSRAARYDRFAAEVTILGVPVWHDARDPRTYGAIDAVVTDPWALEAFEFGPDGASEPLARSIFEVQKRRWRETGVVTAAGEDHVDQPPWFVYGSIWAGGRAWRTVTTSGEDASPLQGLSTKAAFSLATLYPDDPYAKVLREAVAKANDPQRGWYAGIYERGGVNRSLNANTNGVLLEALLYKLRGPLHGDPAGRGRGAGPLRAAVLDATDAACPTDAVELAAAPQAGSGSPQLAPPSLAPGLAQPSSRSLFRLDGTLFTGYRGADGPTAGAVATLWPWGFTFLRIGGEATPMSKGGSSRLLWGAGYDDWHGNTFFLHVDNWGPIRPSDGFANGGSALLDQAEVNVGYRLPRLCVVRSVCLAPMASVTTPFVGGPYVSARLNLTIFDDWFLMGGIGWTIPGLPTDLRGPIGTPDWRVVYGFGRSSWRPGSLFITYYDWGPNYRYGNGILAVGVNWAF